MSFKNLPLVSVIMNCHNSDTFLEESINSVVEQTYQNWELIFWDNNSTDNSRKVVETFKDNRIKYFFNNEYTPLGEARNLAIKKSNGLFIAFLDCDDLWMPKKLELQIPKFDDPKVGIVISNSIFFNANKKEKILYKRNPKEGYVFKELLEAYYISLETAMIRKSELNKLSEWFDNRFEVIEEFDLFIRLSKECKLAYVKEILGKWRVHQSSWTWKRKDLFPRETRLFINKIYKIFPEARTIYKKNIEKLYYNIICQEFLIAWEKRKFDDKKNELKKIIFKSKKAFIFYILSFIIPYSLYNYMNSKRLILK
tara:strand:- start:1333 stop:2265 length:933 start_codon:yes stop_codon:yes gene_type:complete